MLSPALGPPLLALAGLLAMHRGRAISNAPALHAGRLFVATLVCCAILLVPVALYDIILCSVFSYVAVLVAIIVLPFHLVCVATFAAGLYAISKAEAKPVIALRGALPAIVGLLVGIALTFVRFQLVPFPHSKGIFLKAFAASGSALRLPTKPIDPHWQQDIIETLGDMPRSDHEPIAAIGDDSLWLVRRSRQADCPGYWIERRAFAPGGAEWRQCLPAASGVTRNPSAFAIGPDSGVVLVGFDVLAGNESCWLKRYDARGSEDKSWGKALFVGTKINRSYGLRLGEAGFIYVFGESGEIDERGTFGWVRKFHPDGREQIVGWDKRFPNAGKRQPTMAVVDAAADSSGGLSVLLSLYGAYSLRKFDRDGRELWHRELPELKDLSIGADKSGDLFVLGASGYPGQAWIKKLRADGGDALEKTFALGDMSSATAIAFDEAQNAYVAGYGTRTGDKATYWWIKKLGPDGGELTGWDKSLGERGSNMPFALHVNSRDELYILGTGNGWQFSGSWLERWWGW
jgi:hypothetical protein